MKRMVKIVYIVLLFALLAMPAWGLIGGNGAFAFKNELVWFNAKMNQAVYGETGNAQVILGKDGWLFFDKTLDDYYALSGMSDDKLMQLVDTIAEMDKALREKGITLTILIAPNKNTIYPEKMPAYAIASHAQSDLARVQQALAGKGVTYLDAEQVLLSGKEHGPLYYQTDTHWNAKGALLIYREYMTMLGAAHEEYADIRWEKQRFSGDLAGLYLPLDQTEEEVLEPITEKTHRVKGVMRSLSDMTIRTQSDRNDIRLYVIRDSFGEALFPYLANNVGEMTYSRAKTLDIDAIADAGVNHVLLEFAQRNLQTLSEISLLPQAIPEQP